MAKGKSQVGKKVAQVAHSRHDHHQALHVCAEDNIVNHNVGRFSFARYLHAERVAHVPQPRIEIDMRRG